MQKNEGVVCEKRVEMDQCNSDQIASAIPAELLGRTPRTVALAGSDSWCGLFVAILACALGIYGLASYCLECVEQYPQRAALRAQAKETDGEICNIVTTRHAGTYVEYVFVVNGMRYRGEARIAHTGETFDRFSKIVLRYVPANPVISHPAAWEWSALMDINLALLATCFFAVGCAILIYLLRERGLLRTGIAAKGVVTRCERHKRIYRVSYEFHTHNGDQIDGTSDSEDEYELGTGLWLVYSPKSPKRNRSYPMVNFRVIER